MLFKWLSGAIRHVEGDIVDAKTFESAYFEKYKDHLIAAEKQLGMSAENQATAFGSYQILGENLARYHGFGPEALERFLTDPDYQSEIARAQFYIMLKNLVERRGINWPRYLFSMWNAGVNYNKRYDRAIVAALKAGF